MFAGLVKSTAAATATPRTLRVANREICRTMAGLLSESFWSGRLPNAGRQHKIRRLQFAPANSFLDWHCPMAVVASNSFSLLLEKSDLLTADELQQARKIIEAAKGDSVAAAKAIIKQNLLTRWQAEQLLRGRAQLLLGKYELLDRLGAGGMGHVFLAEHRQMKRRVALKTLNRELAKDPEAMKRLVAEARAIASLDHPNIIRAYDLETEGDLYYIVMEYVEGRDLERAINADKKLPVRVAADYIRQAAAGLMHAHDKGMIHRDIKPANLLIDKQGVVKILDLGLAQLSNHADQAGQPVEGTVDYLSPEQATGSKDFDCRADIYSLGCTLYFSLTGHAPFPDGSLAQKLTKHQMQEPKAIDQERPETPGMLIDICRRMMAKSPSERYQKAADVVAALNKWLDQSGPLPAAAPNGNRSIAGAQGPASANGKDARGIPLPRRSSKGGASGEIGVDQSGGHSLAAARHGSSGAIDVRQSSGALDFIDDLNDDPLPVKADSKKSPNSTGSKDTVASANKTGGMKTVSGAKKTAGKKAVAKGNAGKAEKLKRAGAAKPRIRLWASLAVGGIGLVAAGIVAAVLLTRDGDAAKKSELAVALQKDKEKQAKADEQKAAEKPFRADQKLEGGPEVKPPAVAPVSKVLNVSPSTGDSKNAATAPATVVTPVQKSNDPKDATQKQVASVDIKPAPGPVKTGNPIIDAGMADDKSAETPSAPDPAPKPNAAKPNAPRQNPAKPAPNKSAPAKPPEPPAPATPANPLEKIAKSVDLAAVPKAGENTEPPTTIGQVDAASLAELECKFVPPAGAKGRPLSQYSMVRKDAEPGVPAWIITAKSSNADSPELNLAAITASKDGTLSVGWQPDAAKVTALAEQIRNAAVQLKSGAHEHLLCLRAPKVIEPWVLELDGKYPAKGDFKLQKPLEVASLPHPDGIFFEIQKLEVNAPTVKVDMPSKPQSPLPTPVIKDKDKDKEPFAVMLGEKMGRDVSMRINFSKGAQHLVLDVYPQFKLLSLKDFAVVRALHLNDISLESENLDTQLTKIVPSITSANDKKNTELAKELTAKKKAMEAARKEMEGINAIYGAVNKNAKLYFRVFAKIDNYEVELLNTGPVSSSAAAK